MLPRYFTTIFLFLLILPASLAQRKANTWKEVQSNGQGNLVVLYSENRPFIYKTNDGNVRGIEHELLTDFVKYINEAYNIELTISWQHIGTFQHLYDSLLNSKRPTLGVASLSITDERKGVINLSNSYLPDIEIIVSSRNFSIASNLKEFTNIIKNSRALSVPNSTFERNILELRDNYFPSIRISNVSSVDVLIDSIAGTENIWGYISLPNYLTSYRASKNITRQRFFMVENKGVAIGGSLSSDWNIPLNEYLETPRFRSRLNELVDRYLGPTFAKVAWSISENGGDSLGINTTSGEVGLLTLENELQMMKLRKNELEIENKNLIIIFVIIGIFLLTIALFALFRMMHLKTATNKQLSEKNERIKQQSATLKNSYENLKTLSDIGREISASLSVEKINEIIFETLNSFMDVGVFGIGLYQKEDQSLEFSGVMEKGKRLNYFQYDLDDKSRLASICFNEEREIVIQNLSTEYIAFLSELPETKQGDQAESIIYFPLTQGKKKIGVLTVQSFNQNAFSDYQVNLVRNIANYSTAALDNASAYQLISEANREIQDNNKFIESQNAELVSLNREKNELIGIVAHDLKNPLGSALSVTDTFRSEEGLSEDQQEYLYLISKCLIRMNDLISKILNVKAMEANTIELKLEDVELRYIVEEAVDELNIQAQNKGISIDQDLIPGKVEVDPGYALDVFENLISNAVKFSQPGSKISISMSEQNGSLEAKISDNGPGLTKEDQSKLFGKFQKLSAKPTGGETSTGLGLSIVKKYVEVMKGEIKCESEPGKGADFIVSFAKIA